jgi:lysophospholipase
VLTPPLDPSIERSNVHQAARQGHEGTVDLLLQAGATLGGQDLNGGYVRLALKTALRNSNYTSIRVWSKAGLGSGEACCEPQK